ncbi:hypothetical protein VNPA152081_26250 [Pseudomonas aeruginosa]|nr:hypothetical protein VNPA141826_23230 [Pseudomonas aeruginosa]GLF77553.1 hypothetical protein VNPA152081_26250 [Pseudomonas aeruginosa]
MRGEAVAVGALVDEATLFEQGDQVLLMGRDGHGYLLWHGGCPRRQVGREFTGPPPRAVRECSDASTASMREQIGVITLEGRCCAIHVGHSTHLRPAVKNASVAKRPAGTGA